MGGGVGMDGCEWKVEGGGLRERETYPFYEGVVGLLLGSRYVECGFDLVLVA